MKLKKLRLKKVISLRDLEKMSGVSHATISRLENGIQKPRFVTIRKLAEALGVPPNTIDF